MHISVSVYICIVSLISSAMARGPAATASVLVLDPSLPTVSLMLDTGVICLDFLDFFDVLDVFDFFGVLDVLDAG